VRIRKKIIDAYIGVRVFSGLAFALSIFTAFNGMGVLTQNLGTYVDPRIFRMTIIVGVLLFGQFSLFMVNFLVDFNRDKELFILAKLLRMDK